MIDQVNQLGTFPLYQNIMLGARKLKKFQCSDVKSKSHGYLTMCKNNNTSMYYSKMNSKSPIDLNGHYIYYGK